jgi:hypothetical protein
MGVRGKAGLVIGAAILAGAAGAPPAPKQVVTGPVATYWMSAQTSSGFGAMGAGGGGRPSLGSIMSGMRGGNVSRSLLLQLGSAQKPAGAPVADHLPPQGLGAGPDLPLVTPVQQAAPPTREEPGVPRDYQKPRGRMLIFWGCGEHARPGQPVVIDFAKVAEGQMPPAFAQMMRGLNITPMQPPSPSRNATYGEWPNAKGRTSVPAQGSLVGDHVVRGNYSPEIRFSLTPDQDFMPAFDLTSNAAMPSGAMQLAWRPVRSAQAYAVSTMGGDGETVVLWSSSEVQSLMFALPDYLRPEDIQRLLAQKALLAPATTSCAVPKEAVDAAPQSIFNLVAYGPEADFAFPARPADPKVPWNIAWTVKVRYRSATGGMLGMSMPGMAGGEDQDAPARPGQPKPKPAKPKAGDVLKGLGLPFPH